MKRHTFIAVGGIIALVLAAPVVLKEAEERIEQRQAEDDAPTALFMGDIMLDRSVARHARAVGSQALFAGVKNIFGTHDLVVGNLEGAITENPSVSEVDNSILRFTFAPALAETLADAGITAVSLANNHALDFGEFGYEDTLYYLEGVGIEPFGSPFNETRLAIQTTIDDKTFCFVGYHELFQRDPKRVVEKLEEIEPACTYSVIVAHWGVEYEHEPSVSQKELAHLFVDNGADLVIGAHPHVVQPVEVYKNAAIFYSLGNFIFDQGWKGDVRRGAMVSVKFGEKETTFTVLPVNTYLVATLADSEVSAAVLADLKLDTVVFTLKK